MATYTYRIDAKSEDGERFSVSQGTVDAKNQQAAKDKAHEEGRKDGMTD